MIDNIGRFRDKNSARNPFSLDYTRSCIRGTICTSDSASEECKTALAFSTIATQARNTIVGGTQKIIPALASPSVRNFLRSSRTSKWLEEKFVSPMYPR